MRKPPVPTPAEPGQPEGRRGAPRAGRSDSDHAAAFAQAGLVAALVAAALLQGAFYVGQLTVFAVLLAGALFASSLRLRLPVRAWAAFGIVAAGMAVSLAANGFQYAAVKPVLTLVAAAAGCELALRAGRVLGGATVLRIVGDLSAAVALAGIAGVAWHLEPLALNADPWRLASTLTYQNAAAALFVLGLGPAASEVPGGGRLARVRFATVLAGLGLTWSRGGLLAALVALVVVAASGRSRLRGLGRPALSAALTVLAVAPAALGWTGGSVVATLGGAAALATAALEVRPKVARRVAAAGVLLCSAAVAALASSTSLGGRVTGSAMDRGRVWDATLDRIGDRPWFGSGPGTFELIGPRGTEIVRTEFAHNEYLQTAAEIGLVGLALVLAALWLLASATRRSESWRESPARGYVAASLAGFLVHSGLDFLWRVPLLVVVAAVLVGAALAGAERANKPPRSLRGEPTPA